MTGANTFHYLYYPMTKIVSVVNCHKRCGFGNLLIRLKEMGG